MTFGDVIRSANSPSTFAAGVGGNVNVIYHCDDDSVLNYELSTTDFSVVRSAPATGIFPKGIGGNENVIWNCEANLGEIHELSIVDLSSIRSASSPGIYPRGIGGDENTIWYSNPDPDRNYELSTTDLSVVRSASSPSDYPIGIGGNANVIWHVSVPSPTRNRLYELSIIDFSTTRFVTTAFTWPVGIGGDENTIWCCDSYTAPHTIYELDSAIIPPTYTLSGIISDELGNTIRDADITISNGTTYTTTSDENGAYSKVVDSDTYDITVSKSRSRFHDITESSVSVTADTTLNITMLTDRKLGKLDRLKGMSIPGGIQI